MTPPFEFTPTVDFFSPELASWYLNGMHYTCRESDVVLITESQNWFFQGKIKPVTKPIALITGTGE